VSDALPQPEPVKEPTVNVMVDSPWHIGKRNFSVRVADEGRMKEFKDFRDELKEKGVPDSEGWRVAGSQFKPLNGASLEYAPTIDTLKWLEHFGMPNPWEVSAEQAEKAVVRAKEEGLGEPTRYAKREIILDTVSSKVVKSAATFEQLAKMIDQHKVAPEIEIIRWVFNNYKCPVEKLDPEEVPSVGALGLLEWVRAGANFGEFFKSAWVKMIPDKRQLEYESSLKDDGRKQLDLCSAFDDEFETEHSFDESGGQPEEAEELVV